MKFKNYKSVSKKLLFTMLLFLTAYSSQATIWYVDSTNVGGLPSGLSWNAAYPNLNNVLSNPNLSQGDTIWVAKGTYYPGTSRTSEFNIYGYHLFGGFDGTETMMSQRDVKANPTVLSGDLSQNDNNTIEYSEPTRSENAYTVVSVNTGSNPTTLDGFIVEGGNANSSTTSGRQRYGGGIYVLKNTGIANSGDVIIENCIFRKNTAVYNGAAYVYNLSTASTNSLKTIFNKCEFRNNQAIGGIIAFRAYNSATETHIFNSLITDNTTNSASLIGGSGRNGITQKFLLGVANSTIVDNHKVGTQQVKGMIRFYNENSSGTAGSIALANNIILDDTVKNTISLSPGQTGTLIDVYLGHNLYQDSLNSYTASTTTTEAGKQFYQSAGDMVQFINVTNGNYALTSCSFGVDEGKNSVLATAPQWVIDFYQLYYDIAIAEDLNGDNRVVVDRDLGCYENQGPLISSFALTFSGTDLTASTGLTNYTWKRNSTTISGANTDTYTPTQNGNYEVNAEDAHGCEYTATYNLNNLSVQDFATANIDLYPNPVSDVLTIGLDNRGLKISVFDLSGKVILQSNEHKINVQSLTKGIYLIKVTQQGKSFVSKFLKE